MKIPRLGTLNVASFNAMNSNFVVFGGHLLYSMNISTGQCVKLLDAKLSLNSLDFTADGKYLFIGDQDGGLGMFRSDPNLSNLTKVRRFLIAPNTRISNISVCTADNSSQGSDYSKIPINMFFFQFYKVFKSSGRLSTLIPSQVFSC